MKVFLLVYIFINVLTAISFITRGESFTDFFKSHVFTCVFITPLATLIIATLILIVVLLDVSSEIISKIDKYIEKKITKLEED